MAEKIKYDPKTGTWRSTYAYVKKPMHTEMHKAAEELKSESLKEHQLPHWKEK